ncbi:MAG: hydroxyacid dehydrogenase [Clostridia bacterium]|nr:hydroxyacid dehydrogenase [Clostridia bacterium]
MKVAFFNNNPNTVDFVFGMGRKEKIAKLYDLYPEIVTPKNIQEHLPHLADLEVIFSTWGMFKLTPEQLDMLPNLKFIFYGAGSVAGFAHCFLERGIRVMSAWGANAIPVAEFTVAQIVLAMKGYFTNLQHAKSLAGYVSWNRTIHHGNFAQTVAILGCGMIGKEVIRGLKDYHLNILVYDPFVSAEQAAQMGCAKVGLLEAFQKADVVTNHMPNIPATVGNIDKACFEAMRDGGVFINTGRGQTVKEEEMIEVLSRRPSLTALLDVTWPEPPVENSPLFTMDNVFLSSHIAGSIGNEVIRMADYCLTECERYVNGEPLQYEITAEMLKTMA